MKTLVDLFRLFEGRDKEVFIYRTGVRRFTYTYQELHSYSLKMASYLMGQGVGRGDRVAIWAPNHPFWAVSYFGIILAGAVVVPIDFASGQKRAETIVRLSGAKFAIQSIYKFEKLGLQNNQLKTVMIEDLAFLLKPQKLLEKLPIINPEEMVEIVYTSGTTGDPKGVVLSHRNIVSNVLGALNHIKIPNDFNFLSILPLSHMLEQTVGLLIPLYHGDQVVYLRTIKPSSIMEALSKENIATMIAVPKFLLLLKNMTERELASKGLKIFLKSGISRKIIASLIHKKFGKNFLGFVVGGATLPLDVFRFWKKLDFFVVEGYGLTECSPIISGNTLKVQIGGSVGKPLKEFEVKFDSGELLVKGPSVFSGYYKNTEKTREAFEDGWFKTGDFAQMDEEGRIHIKGRKKDLIVNASGINIYPDEIEAMLTRIGGVKDAAVVGLDRGNGEEVHAILLLKNKNVNARKIIEKANRKLDPLQKIEGFSVWSEIDFPRTTTLKVQKFKVKQRILNQGKVTNCDLLIRDPLIFILANVSHKSESEIKEDSLLSSDLELTSLSRLELVNYLEEHYRVDLEDTIINQHTTVAHLRRLLEKRQKSKRQKGLWMWLNSSFGRALRGILDTLVNNYVYNYLFDIKAYGLSNLKHIKGPVIFISNHVSYLDQPVVMCALPPNIRYNTSTASREEFFFGSEKKTLVSKMIFPYIMISGNIFLLPQKRGFRKTLAFMGKLIDRGVNILVFPEGTRTRNGQIQDFMAGLGLMVKELQVPVVPVRVFGMEKIFPRSAKFPKKGKCKVVFGKPIEFSTQPPSQIVEISRNALLGLHPTKS